MSRQVKKVARQGPNKYFFLRDVKKTESLQDTDFSVRKQKYSGKKTPIFRNRVVEKLSQIWHVNLGSRRANSDSYVRQKNEIKLGNVELCSQVQGKRVGNFYVVVCVVSAPPHLSSSPLLNPSLLPPIDSVSPSRFRSHEHFRWTNCFLPPLK